MEMDRRAVVTYAAVAFAVAASWIWATGQIAGPAAAHTLAYYLGIGAVVAGLSTTAVVLRRFDVDTRHATLATGLVVLAAAGGVVAATHITGSPVSGTVTIQTQDGLAASVTGASTMDLTSPQTLSGTANVVTEQGNITFFSAGAAEATIDAAEIEGAWTNVTGITADPDSLQIDPADKSVVTVAQEIDSFNYTGTFAVGDGTVDFVYAGTSGASEVQLSGVDPNQGIAAIDADTGDILDQATSDSNGQITFDALANSQHAVLLQTSNFNDPIVENPSPTGGLQSEPSALSVDVKDVDFSDGDSVTVTIDLDGSQVHQATITSNQTVSTSIPASGKTGGSHDWTVEADPDYGSVATEQFSYSVPDTLYVRNASNHSQLIDSPLSVDGTFFSDDVIVERTGITDGTIDMTGLPVSDSWIVEVEPSSNNYTTRALWLNSIYQQESIYLLNKSKFPTIESRFVLSDPTGTYGPESILFIQRPINISGTTTWQTVHSDQFGAEGVTATLEEDQRYRIRVRNQRGNTQIIGPYRSDVGETVEVVPGSPSIERGEFVNDWSTNAELTNDGTNLEWRYEDPGQHTDELTVWIHERGNESNALVANASFFDIGTASATHSLAPGEQNTSWDVVFIVDRNGTVETHRIATGGGADLFAAIPSGWRAAIGIGSLFLLAGTFSILNAAVGAVIVALVGGLWWFVGLLPGATMGIAVALAIFLAVLNWVRQGGGP